ncbi:hypothetical protein BDW02DRAFT_352097 [Decorospora gaudefroyi]|uniref:Uncharacterized protein n=1 Tax=Decorospora gaudefroyi TaxID=184978 RepID=A0A6A5JUW7_9PLEO|nr:hypothetical protein BDW02DRAFT_352097 [Decorospora gaudefroyi]
MYFGQFALEYAMGKGLDSIFGDEEAPPPLSAADLNAFGDQLIEDIENIVVDAISQFAEDRDTISVDAHIKTLVAWRPTAEAGHLDGLQGDERTLERKNGEFDQIMGFLKTPSYTAFATPYFLAAAGAKLHLVSRLYLHIISSGRCQPPFLPL